MHSLLLKGGPTSSPDLRKKIFRRNFKKTPPLDRIRQKRVSRGFQSKKTTPVTGKCNFMVLEFDRVSKIPCYKIPRVYKWRKFLCSVVQKCLLHLPNPNSDGRTFQKNKFTQKNVKKRSKNDFYSMFHKKNTHFCGSGHNFRVFLNLLLDYYSED